MIRLFASDMDGTLLNDKGYISDRTINAVKKLQKHGIHFIVNTGRDYRAAKRELDAASLSYRFASKKYCKTDLNCF